MPETTVHIDNFTLRYSENIVLNKLCWEIHKNENYLLGGKSGSGKTSLAKAIAGSISSNNAININFAKSSTLAARVIYIPNWYQFTNLEGDRNFYYQQRYNHHQQGHNTLTVKAELEHFAAIENLDFASILPRIKDFGIKKILNSQLIELSSGEQKKLQLIRGLWLQPQLLILDEPYTGLDQNSRTVLNKWLDELTAIGVQLLLISNNNEIPNSINKFAQIVDGQIEIVNHSVDFSLDQKRKRKTFLHS